MATSGSKQSGKSRRTYRSFSDGEKVSALEVVNLCGGNVLEASRLSGIAETTLRDWTKGHCVAPDVFADFAAKKQGLMTAKLRALADRLVDELASEERIKTARYGELNATFGTIFDKLSRIDEKPPGVAEPRNDATLRKEAEEILAALLPEYGGDKAAALAAMREVAPTLSEYVN